MKILAGKTDLEDAVKRLDKLTQEEARMALIEVLRTTRSVRDEVKVVDNKVESTSDKVEDVGNKLQIVDEKVQVVIGGAQACTASHRYLLTFIS